MWKRKILNIITIQDKGMPYWNPLSCTNWN